MRDWFEWKGERCTNYGVHVMVQPGIVRPTEREEAIDVPGRSGALTLLEGEDVYEEFIAAAECTLHDPNNITRFSAWLRGTDKVRFAARPEGVYRARVTNQIDFALVMRGHRDRTFTVNFRCFPFLYLDPVHDVSLETSGKELTNPCEVFAEPIITVYGSGNVTLTVGDRSLSVTGLESAITLDCEAGTAYNGTTAMGASVTVTDGLFPILGAGKTAVSWTGNVTRVVVRPNWRTL